MIARIRWRLLRTVLTGGILGTSLTLWLLGAGSSMPWERFVGGPSLLTPDGWALVGVATLSLVLGGLVQLAAHESRLRALAAATASTADESGVQRTAVLRGLPLVSAAASFCSWCVGGAALAALSNATFHLSG